MGNGLAAAVRPSHDLLLTEANYNPASAQKEVIPFIVLPRLHKVSGFSAFVDTRFVYLNIYIKVECPVNVDKVRGVGMFTSRDA